MTATRTMGWTPRERLLAGLCVISLGFSIAAYFDFGGSAGAAPRGSDGPITSEDIPKGTIRGSDIAGGTITSADVRNRSLKARDLGLYHRAVPGGTSVPGAGLNPDASAHVSCDAGDKAISGGYTNGNPGSIAVDLSHSEYPPGNRWMVSLERVGNTGGFVYTHALCLNG